LQRLRHDQEPHRDRRKSSVLFTSLRYLLEGGRQPLSEQGPGSQMLRNFKTHAAAAQSRFPRQHGPQVRPPGIENALCHVGTSEFRWANIANGNEPKLPRKLRREGAAADLGAFQQSATSAAKDESAVAQLQGLVIKRHPAERTTGAIRFVPTNQGLQCYLRELSYCLQICCTVCECRSRPSFVTPRVSRSRSLQLSH
jgi:hypothetical protein